MKNSFLAKLFFAVAAGVTNGGGTETQVLTSENLAKLQAEYDMLWAAMIAVKDPRSKEAKDAKLAVLKKDGEIRSEEQAIQKAANDAKISELRNQRLQLSANYKAAILANTGKGANEATATAEATALELLNNELLAKYAHSAKAKSSGEPKEGGSSSEQKAAILEMARAGKTKKEIEEAGFARSTVWHTINNAKKAGETFPNH